MLRKSLVYILSLIIVFFVIGGVTTANTTKIAGSYYSQAMADVKKAKNLFLGGFPYDLNEAINLCTSAMNSGSLSGDELAEAYMTRSLCLVERSENDRKQAMIDVLKANKINSKKYPLQ